MKRKLKIQPDPSDRSTDLILRLDDLRACNGRKVALDVETTGLTWYKDKLIGVGVWCPDAGVYGYIPTLTDGERSEVKEGIKDLWEEGTVVIAHNAKFDLHFMGIDPYYSPWQIVDSTVLIHLLDSRYKKGAEEAEETFLGTDTKKQFYLANKRKKIWDWTVQEVSHYCTNDCRVEFELARLLTPQVAEEGLWDLFCQQMNYLSVIWGIERHGVLLDVPFINWAIGKLSTELDHLEKELYEAIGYKFNWKSAKQLSQALYDDLGIPVPENPFKVSRFNRDKGKYNSTNTSTFLLLEKAHHPLGELVSSIRETDKLRHVYLEKWLQLMDSENRLHTNYNLTGTRTGRVSSSDPNLQNLPSDVRGHFTRSVYIGETERQEAYNLRQAVIAPEGYSWVSVDYKQMEMRMFGLLSGDPFMLDSLAAGRDIHGDIAEAVWGERDPTHREWAKMISFGLIYGMSTGSLQFKLDLPPGRAKEITDQYWSTFPRIKPWLYGTADECKVLGYTRYWSGRRWCEDDENSFFKAANALIQGGCADLLSTAAIRARDWLEETGAGTIVNLVHDEIIVECPDENIDFVGEGLQDIMRVEDLFDHPWLTDIKVGKTYGSLQKVEKKK